MTIRLLHRALALSACLALLTSCATPKRPKALRSAAEVRTQLLGLLPTATADKQGWARDIQVAFESLELPASSENLCAALAVIEQESTFSADPVVPGLAKIARGEIDRRATRLKIPQFLVNAALRISSPDGSSYAQRIAMVRTEKQLSELFEEFIGKVPLGQRIFGGANPVRTGGPMQVSIRFAEQFVQKQSYPYATQASIRNEVFSRRGGLYFGIAHLLDYPNSYERHIFRYADFNAGWYASRNAAFQAAVTKVSGVALALDGDLVVHGGRFSADKVSATESAVRSLSSKLEMSDAAIRRALDKSDRFEFEESDLYARVYALADARQGAPLPRAVIPRITLESPKITRKLTTEWFATRVHKRYQTCVAKAFAN